jgi:endoglucanase
VKRLRFIRFAWLLCAMTPIMAQSAPSCDGWPSWQSFRQHFVSDGGRVVDLGTNGQPTTSEGQSYGLLFALIANDRAGFERQLGWTRDNLAAGDLSARLPAWLWGRREDGSWGVIDDNSASDADAWIAYSLIEAGRLWHEPRYAALGQLLALRIAREESVALPRLGLVLLPGARGFGPKAGGWRLNPSYLPLQVLTRLAHALPASGWPQMLASAPRVLLETAPAGFAPDWALWQTGKGFLPDTQTAAIGSYNAIRVYLWAGMLDERASERSRLLARFKPMADRVARDGQPPEKVDARNGNASGTGPVGFSAALLPFLVASGERQAADTQALRLAALPLSERPDAYYDHVLTLFGLGWREGRFRFAADGRLEPAWEGVCPVLPPA